MNADTKPSKRRDSVISSLNMAIDLLIIAKEMSSITPAKAVFGSVSTLLVMIKVRSLLFCITPEFQFHVWLGFDDQRSGLRCSWTDLC